MTIINNKQKDLIELWERWNELFEDGVDETDKENQRWITKVLAIEQHIYKLISEIHDCAENKDDLIEQLNLDVDESLQFIYYHIILSIVDDGVFNKKVVYKEMIDNSIQNNPGNTCESIQLALRYCDTWVKEIVIGLMLDTNNQSCVAEGLEAIANARVKKYEYRFLSILEQLTKDGYVEKTREIYIPLLDAIVASRAKTCQPLLERLLENNTLQNDNIAWKFTLFSLVYLGSNIGWATYMNGCSNKTLYPSEVYLLGEYGAKSMGEFIKKQIESTDDPDWLDEYIYALGKLGDTDYLELILNTIDLEDTQLTEKCISAFYTICGEDESVVDTDDNDCDEDGCKKILLDWLKENNTRFNSEYRYFEGKPVSIQALISDLTKPSYGTRLKAIEKLSAYTNVAISYDPNGFVSEMLKSQKAWQDWYLTNQTNFPEGYWYLDGKSFRL